VEAHDDLQLQAFLLHQPEQLPIPAPVVPRWPGVDGMMTDVWWGIVEGSG
jgi:hypothetical protein